MLSALPLTELMVRNHVNALRRLHGMLENDGIRTRAEFRDMMVAAFDHGGLELRSLSDELGFSFSTVFRWQSGQSAPHASLWPTILTWVLSGLSRKIADLEGSLSAEAEAATE